MSVDQIARRARSTAMVSVLNERWRQVDEEGWTPEHDDEHGNAELASAAACYCMQADGYCYDGQEVGDPPAYWPWAHHFWKPGEQRENLVKAGALIIAEIERLDRAVLREESSQ